MRALAWWLVTLPLLPWVLGQAIYTRRTTVRLAEAADAAEGMIGAAEPVLRLRVIGESTAASVGVKSHSQGLAAQWAHTLSTRTGRSIAWQTLGENGICLKPALERLVPVQLEADAVLFCFGVNDVTKLTSLKTWEACWTALCDRYAGQKTCLILSGVPPMQHFSALPWPLRSLLGWRAQLLNRSLAKIADHYGAHYLPLPLRLSGEDLAEDGFHPSARGYRLWGEVLALNMQDKLTHKLAAKVGEHQQ